jgi:uncharacterized membrane protein YphA (DoxX/SURF4 family)
MKGIKITYWAATGILALMMVYSAYAYLTDPAVAQGFQHLGFPGYFRVELGIAKLIGGILLLAPVSARIKEWTYAGFAICFVSAFIAHTASGDPVANRMGPLIFLGVLVVSYVMYLKKGNRTAVATA